MTLFKTRLRVLRAEREWSQANLVSHVGVSRQTINSIEKGRFHPISVWHPK
jgi:putative transcriptional regulator